MSKIWILFAALFLTACKSQNTNKLEGSWKLVETYTDPGDGSGTPEKISSDKAISLKSNYTFIMNGDICSMNTESKVKTSGTFEKDEETDLFVIKSEKCLPEGYRRVLMELKNNNLYLYYPCREGCHQMFEKVSD